MYLFDFFSFSFGGFDFMNIIYMERIQRFDRNPMMITYLFSTVASHEFQWSVSFTIFFDARLPPQYFFIYLCVFFVLSHVFRQFCTCFVYTVNWLQNAVHNKKQENKNYTEIEKLQILWCTHAFWVAFRLELRVCDWSRINVTCGIFFVFFLYHW